MSDLAVEVHGLTKAYRGLPAVRGIDFDIRRGEIFALLGPNGAGKTTTIEILEGYRQRDGGQVKVLGIDPREHPERLRKQIGIVLQSTGVEQYLTVAETIAMYSSYYPHPRPLNEVIELVGLETKRDSRVNRLSGGQQRRLDVAVALAGDPDVLFLDEPTTGFDPTARREAWEVVKNLTLLGKTVLLTTHYMDEAQYLSHRVAVIADGRIVASGAPSTLAGRDTARPVIRFRLGDGSVVPEGFDVRRSDQNMLEVTPEDLTGTLHRLTGWAVDRGIELEALEIVRPTLEDVYLELTGIPTDPSTEPVRTRSRRSKRSA
jgi:ABC-2 type transport system ATP-binding protein